jgi:hypothetical protein
MLLHVSNWPETAPLPVDRLNEKLRSIATQIVSPIDSISDVLVGVDAPLPETDAFVREGLRVHGADAAISNSRGQNTAIRASA